MLDEFEIRNWRDMEIKKLQCIIDPVERRCYRVAVAELDGVLND